MIDRVDRNVQRLLHMLEGIKRSNEMLAGVAIARVWSPYIGKFICNWGETMEVKRILWQLRHNMPQSC